MKKILILIFFSVSLFAFKFSYLKLNNIDNETLLTTSAPYKQFLAGYVKKNKFTIITHINDKKTLRYLPETNKSIYIQNKTFGTIISTNLYYDQDLSINFYPDYNNLWINKPIFIYLPFHNIAIVVIDINKNNKFSEIYDLKNVFNFYKKYDNLVFVGDFKSSKNYLKNIYDKQHIFINKINTKIVFDNKINFDLNVLSNNNIKVEIDKAIIEKSLIGYKDFKNLTSYYPIIINYENEY